MFCSNCGKEIQSGINFCPNCGASTVAGSNNMANNGMTRPQAKAKVKKPLFKKWWFWVLIVLFVVVILPNIIGENSDNSETSVSQLDTREIEEITVDKKADPYQYTKEWLEAFGFDLSSIPDSESADCFCYYAYACARVVKEQKGYNNMSELWKENERIFVDGTDDFKAVHKVYAVNNDSNEKLYEVFYDLADFTGNGINQIIDMCSSYATADTYENSDMASDTYSDLVTVENFRDWYRSANAGDPVRIILGVILCLDLDYYESYIHCYVLDGNGERSIDDIGTANLYNVDTKMYLQGDVLEVTGIVRGKTDGAVDIDAVNVIMR